MPDAVTVRIGTRGSPLALAQANEVADTLVRQSDGDLTPQIVTFTTRGDQLTTERLINSGGKGLFTKEIDRAVADGEVDIAVHSLKDVPSELPVEQSLLAVLERADPREGFVSPVASTLMDLPKGAVVATASLRREAQTRARRPDLILRPLRGSVQTRLRKLEAGEGDATYLAMAGLRRLGLAHLATPITIDEMLPAPCQGIIAVAGIARGLPPRLRAALAAMDHSPTRRSAEMERAFLAMLDGSCRTPIAGHAQHEPGGGILFRGAVYSPDGRQSWTAARNLSADEASGNAARVATAYEVADMIRCEAGGDLPQFKDV